MQHRTGQEGNFATFAAPEHRTVTAQNAAFELNNHRQPPTQDLDNQNPTLNLASKLGAFPASSVRTEKYIEGTIASADLISRGVISLEAANDCLVYFVKHLNPYMHGILDSETSLSELRAHSTLLTAAVCVVASFCSASERYQACYDALVAEVSSKLFSPSYTYDDVRGLCISAFWLDDIAASLCGLGEWRTASGWLTH